MKVLWLSGRILSADDNGCSGTWLQAMAEHLVDSDEVQLGNVTEGPVCTMVQKDYGPIRQWILPSVTGVSRGGLPGSDALTQIAKIVEQFCPDVIHVWGTEFFWGLLTARRIVRAPAVLLEMQGLKLALARLYCGGLSFTERLACMGPKEWLRGKGIWHRQREYLRWGAAEREIIRGHQNICVPSPWMEAQVRAINSSARMYGVDFPVLDPFHQAEPWCGSGNERIFCSAAYSSPFKGLHVAVRAIGILKKAFPRIQLRIAGPHQRSGLRRNGYISWLNREIRHLGLQDTVVWLGRLSVDQIISELRASSAALIPSFVESYSLALCEAMMLGVPSVVSFTGGTAYLAGNNGSVLFFPAGDAEMCAYQLARLLTDRDLAKRLSRDVRDIARSRHDPDRIRQRRIEIYRTVLKTSSYTKSQQSRFIISGQRRNGSRLVKSASS
jgi:glycosyltransferase involved in cell wall biosynthesis